MNKTNSNPRTVFIGARLSGKATQLNRLRAELLRRNFVIGQDDGWVIVPEERRPEFYFLLDSLSEKLKEEQEDHGVKNGRN